MVNGPGHRPTNLLLPKTLMNANLCLAHFARSAINGYKGGRHIPCLLARECSWQSKIERLTERVFLSVETGEIVSLATFRDDIRSRLGDSMLRLKVEVAGFRSFIETFVIGES